MEIGILDTTLRDGSQSLWASGIRSGMIEAVADELDNVGFTYVEVPANPIFFKKMARDLKENPWDVMRMLAQKFQKTPTACMGAVYRNLNTFGTPTPPVLGALWVKRMAELRVLNRVQVMANTADQLTRELPGDLPYLRSLGYDVAVAISFTISPRHTDEYYAETTRRTAALKPDIIYLKDQGGLLTPDRIRTLLPVMLAEIGDIPVEIHSHCTTGLAPLVYLEALRLGVPTLHCGIPPLADGSAQPSVLAITRNARALGFTPTVDEGLIESISAKLMSFAQRDGLPIGRPVTYDLAQFEHQIPGGVISNLRFQLSELGLEHRLSEVLEECVRVREDLGYPIMITPFSQFVATQSAVNVATGERYKTVIDPLIRFAQGAFGEDSGYPWMNQDLRDRFLSLPRAKELAALHDHPVAELSLAQAKEQYGGASASDEDVLLRAIVQGPKYVDDMYAAGPPRRYDLKSTPLSSLVEGLEEYPRVRYVHLRRDDESITVRRRQSTPAG